MSDKMHKFKVQIAHTRNYIIEVQAADVNHAHDLALGIYNTAAEIGGYEIPDEETAVVAVTLVAKP